MRIAGYSIGETVYEDATLHAFRAVREADGLPVIIKASSSERFESRQSRRLHHDYELARQLGSPFTLGVYELLDLRGRPALVVEDFHGQPLEGLLLGAPLPVGLFLRLAVPMAAALEDLHARGLVHRALQPRNLLVYVGHDTTQVKFGDLGLATLVPREHEPARPPRLLEGTLAYMSPEQTGRMSSAIDYRTDFYSLGIIFYEMLTGLLPFQAQDPLEWVHAHLAMEPRPPSELAPQVPAPLSALVMRLLAKMAEERYQSASGLREDLERCQVQWEAHGRIEPFPLGERDVSEHLELPRKLYGRERQAAWLLEAFERVAREGKSELVALAGYSGVGKTSLAFELHRPVLARRGLFALGKVDLYQRDVPFTALMQALRGLLEYVLAEPEERLARWRARLQEAVGHLGQLLVEALPELPRLLGPQPPVPEAQPREAEERFARLLLRFLGAFAGPEHPLVLFLDDLQWAEKETLRLVERAATDPALQHLLVVAAYRDNEVSPSHPLLLTLEAVRKAGGRVSTLVLEPLQPEHVEQLLAEGLHQQREQVRPLALLVHEKTAGNPFFVRQLLEALREEGLLSFDARARAWRWDLARIRERGYTDNVGELMVAKLRRLGESLQRKLGLAACVGNPVEVHTLAVVSATPEPQVRQQLEEASREGLLLPQGEGFRFLHDRVQEAAYSLVPQAERPALHLEIGRLLLRATPPEQLEERLFEIVSQLNHGAAGLQEPAERYRAAELNLRAGRKAWACAAFSSAADYLSAGLSLLPPGAWEERHALAFDLHLESAQCECMLGRYGRAEQLLAQVLAHALNRVELFAAVRAEIALYNLQDRLDRVVERALEHLRALGISISAHPDRAQVLEEYQKVWELLGDRPIEQLAQAPLLQDEEVRATVNLLTSCDAALHSDPNLLSVVVSHVVQLSLRHGCSDAAAYAYVFFGSIIQSSFDRYREAYQFGQVALALVERRGLSQHRARVHLTYGDFLHHRAHPVRTSLPYLRQAYTEALESGELAIACYACNNLVSHLLAAGEPLPEVEREVERGLKFVRAIHFERVEYILRDQQQFVACLRGRTERFGSLQDERFNEQAWEEGLARNRPSFSISECWHYLWKAYARLLAGQLTEAVEAVRQAGDLIWTSPSFVEETEYHFVSGLAHAAAAQGAPEPRRREYLEQAERHRQKLALWAEYGPDNHAHKRDLVAAELARVHGGELEAERLYEEALRGAQEGGFTHEYALGLELAAAFYLGRGFARIANGYLKEAQACYELWGAEGKVRHLEQQYPHLAERPLPHASAGFALAPEQLDLLAVTKASQSISGELLLSRVEEALLRVVLEHAGASRGWLLQNRAGLLTARARAELSEGKVVVHTLRGEPLSPHLLPVSLVHYVGRTRERLILGDPASSTSFASDTYLALVRPRSVLCMPIVRQGEAIGLLYLENDRAAGAFTADKLTVLELLASQAAISLDNASLYAELHESRELLQALIDNSTAAIYVQAWEGRLLLANRQSTQLFPALARALGSRTGTPLPESVPAALQAHDREVLEGGASLESEVAVPREDGVHTYLSLKFALRDEGGRPYAVCSIATDITERKRVELAQRFLALASRSLVAELDYNTALETVARLAVPDLAEGCIVYVVDEDGTLWPAASAAVPGSSLERLCDRVKQHGPPLGEPQRALGAEQPVPYPVAQRTLQQWAAQAGEEPALLSCLHVPLVARGRSLGVLSLLRSGLEDSSRGVDVHLAQELGTRAALALDNARLYREAQEAVRVRDEFLSVASHELKSPLTSLSLQVQKVERLFQRDSGAALAPQVVTGMLEAVQRQTQRLARLGEQLLDVSLLHAGRLELRLEQMDLGVLVRQVLERTGRQFAQAGCQVQLTAPEHVVGRWDRSRLEQVLLNLLSNAMKYGAGRPVRVHLSETADRVSLEVQDEGIGISAADQRRIFERFERATPVRHHFGGLGLGLYISRQLVQAHGGSLRVRSAPGQGALFTLELPRRPASGGLGGVRTARGSAA